MAARPRDRGEQFPSDNDDVSPKNPIDGRVQRDFSTLNQTGDPLELRNAQKIYNAGTPLQNPNVPTQQSWAGIVGEYLGFKDFVHTYHVFRHDGKSIIASAVGHENGPKFKLDQSVVVTHNLADESYVIQGTPETEHGTYWFELEQDLPAGPNNSIFGAVSVSYGYLWYYDGTKYVTQSVLANIMNATNNSWIQGQFIQVRLVTEEDTNGDVYWEPISTVPVVIVQTLAPIPSAEINTSGRTTPGLGAVTIMQWNESTQTYTATGITDTIYNLTKKELAPDATQTQRVTMAVQRDDYRLVVYDSVGGQEQVPGKSGQVLSTVSFRLDADKTPTDFGANAKLVDENGNNIQVLVPDQTVSNEATRLSLIEGLDIEVDDLVAQADTNIIWRYDGVEPSNVANWTNMGPATVNIVVVDKRVNSNPGGFGLIGLTSYTDCFGDPQDGFLGECRSVGIADYGGTGKPAYEIVSMEGLAESLRVKLKEEPSGSLNPISVEVLEVFGSNYCHRPPKSLGGSTPQFNVYDGNDLAANSEIDDIWHAVHDQKTDTYMLAAESPGLRSYPGYDETKDQKLIHKASDLEWEERCDTTTVTGLSFANGNLHYTAVSPGDCMETLTDMGPLPQGPPGPAVLVTAVGCGIIVTPVGTSPITYQVEADIGQLAGLGLRPILSDCALAVDLGCGLDFDESNAIELDLVVTAPNNFVTWNEDDNCQLVLSYCELPQRRSPSVPVKQVWFTGFFGSSSLPECDDPGLHTFGTFEEAIDDPNPTPDRIFGHIGDPADPKWYEQLQEGCAIKIVENKINFDASQVNGLYLNVGTEPNCKQLHVEAVSTSVIKSIDGLTLQLTGSGLEATIDYTTATLVVLEQTSVNSGSETGGVSTSACP